MEKRNFITALIDELQSTYMDIDVMEDENRKLQNKINELEAQIIEIAQGKRTVDYGPMTDTAASAAAAVTAVRKIKKITT